MTTLPNWQKHSKKEKKRSLKPQALRQAKARRQALKKKLLVLAQGTVVELVDTPDLKSVDCKDRAGSSPARPIPV